MDYNLSKKITIANVSLEAIFDFFNNFNSYSDWNCLFDIPNIDIPNIDRNNQLKVINSWNRKEDIYMIFKTEDCFKFQSIYYKNILTYNIIVSKNEFFISFNIQIDKDNFPIQDKNFEKKLNIKKEENQDLISKIEDYKKQIRENNICVLNCLINIHIASILNAINKLHLKKIYSIFLNDIDSFSH